MRFDERKVPQFEMTIYGQLYPKQYKFKYPKAGEPNSLVNVFVYDVKSELIAEVETGTETDIYLPRMQWTQNPNLLCVQRLNRLQNKLELLLADASTGKSKVIYTETNPYYIDITDNLSFLQDGKSFIFTSERDGFNHIYLYNLNGKLIKSTITQQDIKIGDPDQWIFVGNPFNNSKEKNPFGILLAKMRWFPDLIPNEYFGFFANEFIGR
jgi:dipeptidyl-peptidase-4